jgi:hypothetical protein
MSEERESATLAVGIPVLVTLVKRRHRNLEYPAVVTLDDGVHVVVEATWSEEAARDLGYVRFEPGDVFTEHYWRDRWYSIKEVRRPDGALKGWYCDVARPVVVRDEDLVSDDLDLDLWVSADGGKILRLDEEDFVSSGLAESDPATAAQAWRALEDLERLAGDLFRGVLEPPPRHQTPN